MESKVIKFDDESKVMLRMKGKDGSRNMGSIAKIEFSNGFVFFTYSDNTGIAIKADEIIEIIY